MQKPGVLAWIVASLLVTGVVATEPARAAVRTLVAIGSDAGLAEESQLRWAEMDAARIAEVMVDVGGVSATRVVLLQGPTPDAIERALWQVRGQIDEIKRRGERAELFVTYSGHGDSSSLHVGGAALPTRTLLSWLDAVKADATVVILDACRTGGLRAGRARGAVRERAFDITLVDEPAPSGRVVIASASDGEVAQESDDLEGAFFTHHMLAGLRGAADENRDGIVVLSELYGYAHGRTLTDSFGAAAVQHPELEAKMRGQGEVVMARLDRAQATLVLDASLAGSFLVVDARAGRVLFEVQKRAGSSLSLAVPARRLRVLRRQGAVSTVAEIDVARGARALLATQDWTDAPRVAGRSRGADLDTTPWGVSASVGVTRAPALPQATSALALRVERRLLQTPVFLEAWGSVSQAQGGDAMRRVIEGDVRATLGGALETWTLVGRFTAGLGVGGQLVAQRVERKDAARLRAAGLDDEAVQQGSALGPLGAARVGWTIPVLGPWAVEAGAYGALSGLIVDGVFAPQVYAGASAGVAVEF